MFDFSDRRLVSVTLDTLYFRKTSTGHRVSGDVEFKLSGPETRPLIGPSVRVGVGFEVDGQKGLEATHEELVRAAWAVLEVLQKEDVEESVKLSRAASEYDV
jgi:hypothetical protein